MNKEKEEITPKRFLSAWNGKIKEIAILIALALVLIFTAWSVFRDKDTQTDSLANMTDTELKVARILQEIEGVGEANVIVYETNEGIESVVVVCDGANDFKVVMDVREAVAAALGTTEKSVKIYLKKE
ncbi:MAG: hypothetical protein IJ393_05700 [Clostridia bacterium]|nr:hypothetical protein [Clostridia bacterium]